MLSLKKIKSVHVLGIILGLSALVRLIMIIAPARPWWDATVYLGMARYVHSGGLYGAWEFFRPPLWPLILSPFASFGPMALEVVAKVITTIASLGVIYITYKIGQKYSDRAGLVAAVLLASATPFLQFSTIPMTEILSLFFVMSAFLALLNRRVYISGVLAGLAFLTRFPTGIIILVLGIILLKVFLETGDVKTKILSFVRQELLLGLGFATILVPYLVSNYLLYGDIFSPLIAGSGMITQYLWLYQGDWFFYIKKIFIFNPLLFIIPVGLIVGVIARFKKQSLLVASTILLFVLPLLYFSSQPHKEFRYGIMMYPALFLLLGIGWEIINSFFSQRIQIIGTIILVVLGSIAPVKMVVTTINNWNDPQVPSTYKFYQSLESVSPGSSVLTTTPAIAAFSPIKIIEGYNSWEQLSDAYTDAPQAEYVAIDTCELHVCEPGKELACHEAQNNFMSILSEKADLLYDNFVSTCHQMIYKNHISR
jgi:4-amino-4-deoxy-L-arabinose transferase-like glycosyltransferase